MANKKTTARCGHNVILDEAKHEYRCANCGQVFISVTQLLKKHGITRDYSTVPAEVLQRKAERGTLIHKELENFIKTGAESICPEVDEFAKWVDHFKPTDLASEQIVYNELIAGTVDVHGTIDGKPFVADFKTSAELDKKGVAWQLSLYARLLNLDAELLVFHFGNTMNVPKIDPVPAEEIDRLLECESKGELYTKNAIVLPEEMRLAVEKWENAVKEAETIRDRYRAQLLEMFERNPGIYAIETDNLKISYVAASEAKTVDTAAMRKAMPDVVAKFEKVSPRKASIRVTFKKDGAQ
jgi:predicted RNA-binding Zn-ribbon protein involved in translation (DUF1610 family)